MIGIKINHDQINKIIESNDYEELFKKLDRITTGDTLVIIVMDIIKEETNLPDDECLRLFAAYSRRRHK